MKKNCLLQILSQTTTILDYLPYQDKRNIFKIIRNSLTHYHCNHLNSVLVSF